MKNILKRRTVLVTTTVLLSFCYLLIFSAYYSKLFAKVTILGDCCVQCTNYCACDASCGGKCVAYEWCAQDIPDCPGSGTKCCICEEKVI